MEIKIKEIINAIRETRNITLPRFGMIEVKDYKSKSATDVVTEIDRHVERNLKLEFGKIMPKVSFVGEEFGGNKNSECFWLVDPIDGTGHYVRGIPFCTTMVALIKNGRIIFSAIYDFVNDVMYHAELENGAYKNGKKISVSNRSLREAYLVFDIKFDKVGNETLLEEVRSRARLINTLCSGFEYILVATGKIEGKLVYDGYCKDYDLAPGSLLVSEAGGIVRNFKSDNFNYTNLDFIASNPKIFEELVCSENNIEKFMK